MTAYRYWRLTIFAAQGGTSAAVGELQLFDAPGGSNIATGGTPFGTMSSPSNAFDANNSTAATGTIVAAGINVGYDFGAGNEKEVLEARVIANSASTVPSLTHLEASADASSWITASINSWPSAVLDGGIVTRYIDAQSWPLVSRIEGGGFFYPALAQGDPESFLFTPRAGEIEVIVQEAGVPVPLAKVHIHKRSDGRLVARGFTDASGLVTFTQLNQSSADYYVVAFDPDGGSSYNALIYDRVTPIGPA